MDRQQIESVMDAQAACIGLSIAPHQRPGVLTFVSLAAQMAEQVMGLALQAHDESGSVFAVVPPAGRDPVAQGDVAPGRPLRSDGMSDGVSDGVSDAEAGLR
jgi:hypothetical protein